MKLRDVAHMLSIEFKAVLPLAKDGPVSVYFIPPQRHIVPKGPQYLGKTFWLL